MKLHSFTRQPAHSTFARNPKANSNSNSPAGDINPFGIWPRAMHTYPFDTCFVYYVEVGGVRMTAKSDLPQGTLDLLILKVVALGPVHGYAIAQRLQQVTRDVVQVPQGSL